MCGLPAGSLGRPWDTNPGNQAILEAHDAEIPYHLMTHDQQNDEQFIYDNLLILHWFEHRRHGHCGDPNCLKYNPRIRELAAYMMAARRACAT
jgi:hypothetical protein